MSAPEDGRMDDLRKPLFFIAVALFAIAFLLELSVRLLLPSASEGGATLDMPAPGFGIFSLALLDGLLLVTVVLMATSNFIPERIQGRLQGLVTLIVSFLVLIGTLILIMVWIMLFALMTGLLLAVPFGTIAYMVLFGHFPRTEARVTLALLMSLKLGFCGCLFLSHQKFLENRGLLIMVLFSLVANFLVGFLHAFVPVFLTSITDVIAAIIVAILALVWSVIYLVGSLVSVIKVLRVDKAR